MSRYKLGDLTLKSYNSWSNVPRDKVDLKKEFERAVDFTLGVVLPILAFGVGGALSYLAVTAVTSWALAALAPKPDFGSVSSSGIMVNARDPAAPQDFVYGKVRKGGVVTFYETTGTDNVFLHQVIVLAGHEVNAIGDIYINDQLATLDGEYVTTAGSGAEQTNWHRKIRVRKHKGDQTTADSTLTSETSLGSSFIGNDMAYIYVRYEYDQTVFANGLPLVTAVVEGKKVYDPRTSTTAYSANAALCIRDFLVSEYGLDDSSIDDTDFQAAANICDEDVRMNTIVSAGNFIVGKQYEIKTVGSTDFTAIGASANTVGVVFTATGAGSNDGDAYDSENRYEINGIVQANRPIGNVLQDMVTACAGTLYWGMGSWKLKVGAYSTYVKTLTLDDLRSPLSIETRINMRDNFNRVTGTFNDAANKWITADYPELSTTTPAGSFVTGQTYAITSLGVGTDFTAIGASSNTVGVVFKATGAGSGTGAASIFLGEDNGEKSALDLHLPFTTSAAMAQRLAKITLLRGREQMTMTAEFGMEAFELEVGDIVRFSEENPTTGAVQYRYGFGSQNSGTGKEFEVVAWKLSANQDAGDLRIAMTLREISSDAFSWDAEEQAIVANNADISKLSQINQNKKSAIAFQNGLDLLVDATNPQVDLVSAGSFVSSNSYTIVSLNDGSAETVTYTVTVSGGKFYIDGVQQDTLTFKKGSTYKFDLSDSTLTPHPLRLSTTSDGTHGGGSEYTTGVTTNGYAGNTGAYIQITVASDAPSTLYYYCANHSAMGGQINVTIYDTDYTAIGADNNDIGTTFTATGVGTGTGKAYDNTNYGSVQDEITASFKSANPQLTHMSEIPENQVVFAKFTNNADSTQSSLKIWDYDKQLWLEETDDNYIVEGLSNEIVTNDAVLGYIQSAEISALQLNVNDTIDFADGGAIRINRETYDFLPSSTSDKAKGGLFLGNPAGTGSDGTSTNAFYALSTFGIKNSTEVHGIEFTPTDTKITNPTITKTAQGTVQSSNIQSTQTITIKSGSTNPNAVSLTVNSVGGGGGGAAAVSQSTGGANGGNTVYYLILDGSTQSNVTANGGTGAGFNYGADKFRGDAGAASAYASGGSGGGSSGNGGAGSLGSGGGGGGGRPPDWDTSSRKGGAGGGHGALSTTTYDISSYSTVSLVISQIGSGGTGGTGSRGNGGAGGTGVVKYNISTSGPEEVVLETFGVRAWANFVGNGPISTNQTINAQGNVATCYRAGTGHYQITFTNALPDANYAISWSAGLQTVASATNGMSIDVYSQSASGFNFNITDPTANSAVNPRIVMFTIVR
jgi:hypothetical protein